MRQELHDALAASSLTEDFRRTIRARFADGRDIGAARLKEIKAAITAAETEQAAVDADPVRKLRATLDAAMFGTLTPRDPATGLTRPGHAKDGWRDGVSHPFRATVKTWPAGTPAEARKLLRVLSLLAAPAVGASVTCDVLDGEPEETRAQYEALCRLIAAGHVG